LRGLPEIADGISPNDVEALADIAALAVTATNPEVREAFDLMIRGGVPNQGDFAYPVPGWNTGLQILFRICEKTELHPNDRISLANATANAIFVAMGDNQVDEKVYEDALAALSLFRRSSIRTRIIGYPYEALVALCWRGVDWDGSPDRGPNEMGLFDYERKPLDLAGYDWNFISPRTLEDLNRYPIPVDLRYLDVNAIVDVVERYYQIGGRHWVFGSFDRIINIDGQPTRSRNYNNPDFAVAYARKNGRGLGSCGDQDHLFEAILKSQGIAVRTMARKWLSPDGSFEDGHANVIYFDPSDNLWKVHRIELGYGNTPYQLVLIYKPPVMLPGWPTWRDPYPYGLGQYIVFSANIRKTDVQRIFSAGISNSVIKSGMYE